jgi:hypothetical protein
MVKPRGGRGKRAPYETTQMRVPIPIKTQLESLIADYRERVLLGTEDQEEDEEEDDPTEPTDLETIRDQARIIQELRTEVEYLNLKLSNPVQTALKLVNRFIDELGLTNNLHTRNNVNLVKLQNWLQDQT